MLSPLQKANLLVLDRIYTEYELNDRCTLMCLKAIENIGTWPDDKTSRWLGFIQGVLYAEGKLSIDEERNLTRPLFHKAYKEMGIEIPESVPL